MELPIVAGILGLGYYLNDNRPKKNNVLGEPKNIYESKRSLKIRQDELKHAEKVWKEPNRIMPGPPKIDPTLLFNKVDYADNKLPVEFNSYDKGDIYVDVKEHQNNPINFYNTNSPISGGQHGISLTGEPIVPNSFVHNNMVPFFGGRVKQNVDDKANQTVLEHFTGNIDNYQQKKEIGPMFKAETNVSNPYGMASTTTFMHDRIIPSKMMNNVTPIERVRVGPGLNQGYTSQPSGGFQQANTRDYVLPKTVDELRTKNNPKLTYAGRVLSGKGVSKPGKIGVVEKRHPDSFYINSPARYFTTVGAQTGERQRPNIILKDVNRRTTGKRRRFGPATNINGNMTNIRPTFRKSTKIQYKTDGPRHFNAQGQWHIEARDCNNQLRSEEQEEQQALHDYGKSRTNLRKTTRQNTGHTNYKGIIKAGDKPEARNCQEARLTKKRFTTHNNHKGNMQNEYKAGPAYDPNDVARTTLKEQQIDNNHEGFMNPDGKQSYVYDPNDVAKTTLKQQMIDNNHEGFMNPNGKQSYVLDPNDIAKTTIKQQMIDNDRLGVAKGNLKFKCRDPNDKVKTTIKETTIKEDVVGNAYQMKGMGYTTNKMKAKTTIREQTGDTDYKGISGVGLGEKPQSYEQLYNSTVRSLREQVSRGRAPSGSGPKKMNHDINMTTKRVGDIQNKYLNERGLAPTKVYNSLPQPQNCAVTRDKATAPNEPIQDRLDTSILDQLKSNPYTMRKLATEC